MSLACHSLEDDQTKHAERLSCKSGALCHFYVQKQKSCIFFYVPFTSEDHEA